MRNDLDTQSAPRPHVIVRLGALGNLSHKGTGIRAQRSPKKPLALVQSFGNNMTTQHVSRRAPANSQHQDLNRSILLVESKGHSQNLMRAPSRQYSQIYKWSLPRRGGLRRSLRESVLDIAMQHQCSLSNLRCFCQRQGEHQVTNAMMQHVHRFGMIVPIACGPTQTPNTSRCFPFPTRGTSRIVVNLFIAHAAMLHLYNVLYVGCQCASDDYTRNANTSAGFWCRELDRSA